MERESIAEKLNNIASGIDINFDGDNSAAIKYIVPSCPVLIIILGERLRKQDIGNEISKRSNNAKSIAYITLTGDDAETEAKNNYANLCRIISDELNKIIKGNTDGINMQQLKISYLIDIADPKLYDGERLQDIAILTSHIVKLVFKFNEVSTDLYSFMCGLDEINLGSLSKYEDIKRFYIKSEKWFESDFKGAVTAFGDNGSIEITHTNILFPYMYSFTNRSENGVITSTVKQLKAAGVLILINAAGHINRVELLTSMKNNGRLIAVASAETQIPINDILKSGFGIFYEHCTTYLEERANSIFNISDIFNLQQFENAVTENIGGNFIYSAPEFTDSGDYNPNLTLDENEKAIFGSDIETAFKSRTGSGKTEISKSNIQKAADAIDNALKDYEKGAFFAIDKILGDGGGFKETVYSSITSRLTQLNGVINELEKYITAKKEAKILDIPSDTRFSLANFVERRYPEYRKGREYRALGAYLVNNIYSKRFELYKCNVIYENLTALLKPLDDIKQYEADISDNVQKYKDILNTLISVTDDITNSINEYIKNIYDDIQTRAIYLGTDSGIYKNSDTFFDFILGYYKNSTANALIKNLNTLAVTAACENAVSALQYGCYYNSLATMPSNEMVYIIGVQDDATVKEIDRLVKNETKTMLNYSRSGETVVVKLKPGIDYKNFAMFAMYN